MKEPKRQNGETTTQEVVVQIANREQAKKLVISFVKLCLTRRGIGNGDAIVGQFRSQDLRVSVAGGTVKVYFDAHYTSCKILGIRWVESTLNNCGMFEKLLWSIPSKNNPQAGMLAPSINTAVSSQQRA